MIFYDYSGNVWFCEWVFVGNSSAFSNTQSHDILFFSTLYDVRKKKSSARFIVFLETLGIPVCVKEFWDCILMLCIKVQ